jgi:DNA-binding transcriptional LysR family regulator
LTPCLEYAIVAAMSLPDLNLLVTLDAVLSEGSIVRAARRLQLSPSAMSRAVARVREVTGDPLLVRAGRGLAPTPRAIELRERVAAVVRDAGAVLLPAAAPDISRATRTLTIRSREGFVENFGPRLLATLRDEAPGIRLNFVPKLTRDSAALRDGTVDLETGVIGQDTSPELREAALFSDRYVGVMRKGHPLAKGRMTMSRYARAGHVLTSRGGYGKARVDEVLEGLDVERRIDVTVGGFGTAIALARASDLIATVPERHTGNLRTGMHTFDLPFDLPPFTLSLLWHPRMQADPVHQWLRRRVQDVCGA